VERGNRLLTLIPFEEEEEMRNFLALACTLALGASVASAHDIAYVSGSSGEPWGMPGAIEALDDVYGPGNWERLNFPTAVDSGLFEHDCIYLDGGDGADAEFNAFVETNRAALEGWVAGGGKLLINAARWGADPISLDLGMGITLTNGPASDMGHAFDTSHPIFSGPWGATGADFDGDSLAHDVVTGDGLTALMYGDTDTSRIILAEKDYGAGHVIAGGLTLAFFGAHPLWSENTDPMFRNLLQYTCEVPEPASLALLAIGGMIGLLRRR
jgi:hypothetical protein